ncbi:hypothetical protein BV898_02204 [Hypsibius exemplaris]|uniref:Uncharacterized protein n=1 Tax=Hypsibius exemplaris TaxID=2072580 RepID=A0A1W0X8I8_HYPEX|nr:hypothetical protein BV898_02204 [Hypsibius exemplaris]
MDRRACVDLPRLFKTDDSWKKEVLPNEEAIVPAAEIPELNADGDSGVEGNARQNEDKLNDLGLQEVIQSLPRDQRNQGSFRYL